MCHHSDIVDLTALQAIQRAAGVRGVTGDRQALIGHSLDRVRCGTFCCPPHHLGSAHVVADGQIHGDTGLWKDRCEHSYVSALGCKMVELPQT